MTSGVTRRDRRRVRPRRVTTWLPVAWALAVAIVVGLAPPPEQAGPAAAPVVTLARPPQVTDPLPAPGSVVQAGPVVIAARVQSSDPAERVLSEDVEVLVDGVPATGPAVDPDGGLTALAGVEVLLEPGRRRLGIRVGDHGVLREWDVVAVGMDLQRATEDVQGLTRRLGPPVAAEVVVLANPADVDSAVLAAPLAATLGTTTLPTTRRVVPPATWEALRGRASAPGPAAPTTRIVLLGGVDVIDDAVARSLEIAGFETTRIDGADTVELAGAVTAHAAAARPDPSRALVVGPPEPFADLAAAAITAARLQSSFVIGGRPLSPLAEQAISSHDVVLVSDALTPLVRATVAQVLGDGAVMSVDDLGQTRALEAVVVADDVGLDRAMAATFTASPDRAILLGSEAAIEWVGTHAPERVTLVASSADGTATGLERTADLGSAVEEGAVAEGEVAPSTSSATLALPPFATRPAVDADAPAMPAPAPFAVTAGLLDPDLPAVQPQPLRPDGLAEPALQADLRRAWVDGADPPRLVSLVDPVDGLRISVTAPDPVTAADLHVTVVGYEWPGDVTVDGNEVTWTGRARPALPLTLEPPTTASATPVEVTVAVTTGDRRAHDGFAASVPLDPVDRTSPEGWTMAGGSTGVTGTGGRLYTYSVEVEPQTGLDIAEVEAEISRILTDPRSWTADGGVSFQRVGSSRARLRVVVATPATVDAKCGAVGLRTGGSVSCWDGFRAMLNLDRWNVGVPHFRGDLTTYREYLVNHEVGHGLGYGHVGCPRPGVPAPVMMQQTGGVGACTPNGWPFP